MRNYWSCPARTGLLLALSLLLFGCASGGSTDSDQSRASVETSRERAETKTRRAAKIEPDGDYGFTLSEVVRIGSDVRRDYQQGVALLEGGQLEAGVRVLESVVERAPEVTNPFIDLGVAYGRLERYEEAEASLNKALSLSPNHPAALNELGILQRRTGQFAAARASYERALAIHPGFHFALLNLGVLCDMYLQDLTCAHESYSSYVEIVPDDPDVNIWIADVESRLSRTGQE
jgi:tetratricopeptide (TPR) repeat protein